MAGSWQYSPDYRLRLTGQSYDARGQRQSRDTWSVRAVQQIQCLLTTGVGVGQMTCTIADTTGWLRNTVKPRPMWAAELWTTNRWGQWGLCWTGYVDAVSKQFDPEQGDLVTLQCTSPVKLFEITSQTPGDAAAIALAYVQNITGSAVLRYAARACGYPASMLRIHPQADSGSGYQAINGAILTSPDQSKWSSVVSTIQANSGLEWFFDEAGYLYWRQVGFINPWFGPTYTSRPSKLVPRLISEDDIIHADLTESDQGVVTRVEIRFPATGGIYQAAAYKQAPASMEAHLRPRLLVIYAPWIYGQDAATYLAGVLLAQYAAGVATASITIPADPLIGIGSLVTVPALGVDGSTTYYVSSITYQLAWGASWVMTLGLNYGRNPTQQFPYVAGINYPVLTDAVRQGLPTANSIQSLDANNPSWDTTAYHITVNGTLTTGHAATSAYSPGATIQINTQARGKGPLVGPTSNGTYTVVAPLPGQASGTIALKSTSSATGYVTSIDVGSDSTNNPDQGGTSSATDTGGGTSTDGTGDHPNGAVPTPAPPGNTSMQRRALTAAMTRAGLPYISGRAGDDGYDCIGLVAWAYAQVSVTGMFLANYFGPGKNADTGPQGAYAFFQRLGATPFTNMDEAEIAVLC